jgi:hypothetical protein
MDKHWKQKEKGSLSTLIFQSSKYYSLKKIETSSEHLNSSITTYVSI